MLFVLLLLVFVLVDGFSQSPIYNSPTLWFQTQQKDIGPVDEYQKSLLSIVRLISCTWLDKVKHVPCVNLTGKENFYFCQHNLRVFAFTQKCHMVRICPSFVP